MYGTLKFILSAHIKTMLFLNYSNFLVITLELRHLKEAWLF